ncbi:membrane-associated phospholipid phosphatase [Streptomyces canus]|uniref:phosphatase PAP2 family protein n=1 Tax=Streptomyces canus TaxID=58343 RepID=UPI00278BA848|nr:phosphatase PAP2 family protein [Streptomyces canus]MDQ0605208.1 membrane-associated phospholipid phosphatase [Streptomyces canus]
MTLQTLLHNPAYAGIYAYGRRRVDPRPAVEEAAEHTKVWWAAAGVSFPSGHTAAAFAFAGAVIPVWPAAGAACAVSAVTVAAARVHSGAHFPSDVAAGGALGLAAAAPVRAAPRLLWRRVL